MKCRAQLLLSQNTQHAALSEISREEAMHIPEDAMLLRIFFGENDRFEQQSLSEAIVLKAREMHLAGATVLRGPMGYGHSSRLHTAKIMRLSFDLPMVVEIVDTEAKINEFLPVLDQMMTSGLVTLEKVQVLQYGPEGLKEQGGFAKAANGGVLQPPPRAPSSPFLVLAVSVPSVAVLDARHRHAGGQVVQLAQR